MKELQDGGDEIFSKAVKDEKDGEILGQMNFLSQEVDPGTCFG